MGQKPNENIAVDAAGPITGGKPPEAAITTMTSEAVEATPTSTNPSATNLDGSEAQISASEAPGEAKKATTIDDIKDATPDDVPTAGSDATPPIAGVGSEDGPAWPDLSADHPLAKFLALLPAMLDATGYKEVYGLELNPKGGFHTLLVLQKFLRANANDVDKAKGQLLETLRWRKEYDPLAARNEVFSKDKFSGLGYVTIANIDVGEKEKTESVVTWNVYGAVKDYEKTFKDLDAFIRWRIALMELGLEKLNLSSATDPIPDYGEGPDPYQGIQVHDYKNVSFLRPHPLVRPASKKTIEVMGAYYPETLSRKFFVNVPAIMGWFFQAMKLIVSRETVRKFTVLTYGTDVAGELGDNIPNDYGGEAGELEAIGETVKLE